MPYRFGLALLAAGLLCVLLLLFLRRNLSAEAKRGPRWKKKLVLAGILALTSMGFLAGTSCQTCYMTTCYEPARSVFAQQSMERLSDRLPLLERFAAEEKLKREVVEKTLASVEEDIAILEDEDVYFDRFTDAERDEARALREKVKALVERIRARLATEKSPPAPR
ncbi:MAG: hypothetical protein ACYTAF_00235 [Planctomycetota bacterium]|jgi:hypothetical protein